MKKSSINSTSNEDILKTYFLRIKDIPVLTAKEEQDLSRRILGGDSEATRELIESNLKLVVKIAKGYMSADIPLMDLIQEGNIGLLKAVKKFDYRRNVRFSTYASWWIKQSITRALSNKKRCIRLPHRKEDMLRKIQKTSLDLSQHLMREPSIDEVAHYIKMESHEVQDILNLSNGIVSMDSENREENGNLHDVLEDYTYSPDKLFMKKIMREDALKFLKQLFPKEQQVLLYRFAFVGGDRYTLKRISRQLSISPETVRQIEMRALQKLKEQAVELKEYVYD
ncbi:MAG TPA: RNA polymerase sigma factor RpoD/SigA [Spirochaetales bacterium]|nr:RNA polymerase sigma factor RpoD/SigA [Spirochaetales bacterium]